MTERDLETSELATRLRSLGRILTFEDTFVWGCSPIVAPDGNVYVFFSRWPADQGMIGWLADSEICHAVASDPGGPYELVDDPVVLGGAGGDNWDALMAHNPEVRATEDGYVMVYVATRLTYDDTLVERTKIGLAFAESLSGTWTRHPENPVVDRGEAGAWDDVSVDTPTLLRRNDGRWALYYRGWTGRDDDVRNDKIGVAVADDVRGPYEKFDGNPVVDPTTITDHRPVGVEDPFAFERNAETHLLVRDFGVVSGRSGYSPSNGLQYRSTDGFAFDQRPQIGYREAAYYGLGESESDLIRHGRLERPKLLLEDGEPAYLFNAIRGGPHETATGHVFAIE